MKVLWSHSYDRERMPIHQGFFPDNARIGTQAPVPKTVAEHNDRIGAWRLTFGRQ